MSAHGLLLAAGAGRRMGKPKALVDDWLRRSVDVLFDGGCRSVTVVLGAAADDASALLDGSAARVVVADDWHTGQGASLRAGLAALPETSGAVGAVVHLVDLPDVTAAVVSRLLASIDVSAGGETLARAVYDGRPGHPVYLGRSHWDGVATSATGDQGARAYLAAHDVVGVECGDLASGVDRDAPERPTDTG